MRLAATAQAIYGTLCVGLAIALLTSASGLIYVGAGGEAFLLMAALCLPALPICAGLRVHRDPCRLRRCCRAVRRRNAIIAWPSCGSHNAARPCN